MVFVELFRGSRRALRRCAAWGFLVLVGCGGSSTLQPDAGLGFDDNFLGLWIGTSTTTVGGETFYARNNTLQVDHDAYNTLLIAACGPPNQLSGATVTSASTFTVSSFDCGPQNFDEIIPGCNATDFMITAGTGTLDGGTLTLFLTGPITGCGFNPDISTFILPMTKEE